MFPSNRVSEIQRRQMTTEDASNIKIFLLMVHLMIVNQLLKKSNDISLSKDFFDWRELNQLGKNYFSGSLLLFCGKSS